MANDNRAIEYIETTDTLNEGRVKINDAITGANDALDIAGDADDKATEALSNSETTQTQLDTIVIDGDSSVEAAQARVPADGPAYDTLKQRLDTEMGEVTSQLAEKADIQYQSIQVKIPSDYQTLNEAFDKLSELKIKSGVVIELMMESGYEVTQPLELFDGDYSHFMISSVDDVVSLSDDFPYGENLFTFNNCHAPTLNTVIDARSTAMHGIAVHNNSLMEVKELCGVIMSRGNNLVVRQGSVVSAKNTIFTHGSQGGSSDSGAAGITAWGGTVFAEGADTSHSNTYGAQAAHGGVLTFMGGKSNNCGRHGIRSTNSGNVDARSAEINNSGAIGAYALTNSRLNVYGATIKNSGSYGIHSTQSSTVEAREAVITGGEYSVWADRNSTVNLTLADVRDASNTCVRVTNNSSCNADSSTISGSGGNGVSIQTGSRISLDSASVTGSSGVDIYMASGSNIAAYRLTTSSSSTNRPVLSDTNLTAFNEPVGNFGIMWAQV